MDFLYPKFNKVTHKIKATKSISQDYPINVDFKNRVDLQIQPNTTVSVMQENIGPNCQWAKVIVLGQENTNETFFTLQENLQNVGRKETYVPICSLENSAKINLPEVNPITKEIFSPYIDEANGLYSVRIQTDYTKILDSLLFQNLLIDVFYEGVSLLLASRGYRSDNSYIEELVNKYYTFAYVNSDLDLTVNRTCEPITFTVSMPLNFFNEEEITISSGEIIGTVQQTVSFTNLNFTGKIDTLIDIFIAKEVDVLNVTYPNKFIENFVVNFEISSLRTFSVKLNEFLAIEGYPLNSSKNYFYDFNFDNDFNLISIKITENQTEFILRSSSIAKFRSTGDLYNKRIFNYLKNINNIIFDARSTDIKEFIIKNVKYPEPQIITNVIKINGKPVPAEKQEKFRIEYEKNKEECLSLRDIASVARGAADAAIITDPIYHLFIKKDVKTLEDYNFVKQFEQQNKSWEKSLKELQQANRQIENLMIFSDPAKKTEAVKQKHSILTRIKDGITDGAKATVDGVVDTAVSTFEGVVEAGQDSLNKRINLNTLVYCLNRININEVLLRNLLCLLKGSNINDSEILEIVRGISPDILNYINYLESIKNLQGADYIKALSSGNVPDIKIYCAKNSSLIYLIKGLSKIINAFNVTGKVLLRFKTTNASVVPIGNPYKAFIRAAANAVEDITVNLLLQLTNELLSTTGFCEDPPLNPNTNYGSPFNTHQKFPKFNIQENNNPNIIKNNRSDVINEVYNNELQFGFDKDYVVDLIGNLLDDVNCILTPFEIINLLRGENNEIAIILVKNIIKTKYSKIPNDLSFLLNDENKLKLFFIQLGATVDEEFLETIESSVSTYIEPSQVCDEPTLRAREELIKGKLPKDLGVLEQRLNRRKKEAKKIFERIKNGETIIDIAPLCPDILDSELADAQAEILNSFIETTRRTFLPVLNDFSTESKNLAEALAKKEVIIDQQRGNADTTKINIYGKDLFLNIKELKYEKNYQFFSPEEASKFNLTGEKLIKNFIYKNRFFNKAGRSNEELIKNQFRSATKESVGVSLFCPDGQFKPESSYIDFINNKKVFVEFSPAAGFELNPAEVNRYQVGGSRADSKLGKILQELDYFQVIILNEDGETGFDSDEFYSYFYYNDKEIKEFIQRGPEVFFENDTSEGVVQAFLSLGEEFGANGFPRPGSMPFEFVDDSDIYLIQDFSKFDLLPSDQKSLLQSIFTTNFLPEINKIKEYKGLLSLIELFQRQGFFNSSTIINKLDNVITKKILITDAKKSEPFDFKQNFNLTFSEREYCEFSRNIRIPREFSFDIFLEIQKIISQVPAFLLGDESLILNQTETLEKIGKELLDLNPNGYFKIEATEYEKLPPASKTKPPPDDLDEVSKNYLTLTKFDYFMSKKFKKCNVYPHYLNLDFLLKRAFEIKKGELCELQNYEPYGVLKVILVELTIRVYVTDLLLKAVPYLSKLTREEQINFYKEEVYVKILKDFLKKDFSTFTTENASNLNLYYDLIKEMSKEVYLKYEENNFIENIFISEGDEKEIDYFIKKEIYRFFKYVVDKNIFSASEKSYKIFSNTYFNALAAEAAEIEFAEIPNSKILLGTQREEFNKISRQEEELKKEKEKLDKFFNDLPGVSPNATPQSKKNLFIKVKDELRNKVSVIKGFDPNTDKEESRIKYKFGIDTENTETIYKTDIFFPKIIKNSGLTFAETQFRDKDIFQITFLNEKEATVREISTGLNDRLTIPEKINQEKQAGIAIFDDNLTRYDQINELLPKIGNQKLEKARQISETENTIATLEERNKLLNIAINQRNFFKDIFYLDFQFFFAYFLAANTIDVDIRSIFYGTKSSLAQILFSNVGSLTNNEDILQDQESIEEGRNTEDVIKFINNLAYSASPAAFITTDPQYSKYIKYAGEAIVTAVRNILSTVATAQDPNVFIAKSNNLLVTTAISIPFSLLDEETKLTLIAGDDTLILKRIYDARSVLPDAVFAFSAPILPTTLGFAYYAVDSIQEGIYYKNAFDDVKELRKILDEDPCKVTQEEINRSIAEETEECNLDKQIALIKEIDALEEL